MSKTLPHQDARRRPGVLVFLVTALAAFLFSWNLQRDHTHPYYTAAVRSMSGSWHDFLFGAFDPSGFITTDKLPGAFWIQALFVRALGFHPWVVLLPQVLAATACVPLLYVTVRRWAGVRAGLVAAVVYTLTPITAALARTNIPDALMVFFLVLAAHAFWKWDEVRRTPWLVASAWWLGVAFQVKMGQALLAVPVFVGLVYLVGDGRRLRRLVRSAGYGAVVVAVSLSWMVFVTLTPASHRPYIDGSTHNSVWEMVFQYNGFGRLGGQAAGTDPLAGGAVLLGAGGPPGLGRLFGVQTAGQISWLIPVAVLSLAAGLIGRRRRPVAGGGGDAAGGSRIAQATIPATVDDATATPSTSTTAPPKSSPVRAAQASRVGYLFWGGWFTIYALAFTTASGIHPYYTATLAPPIAALTGAGLVVAHRSWTLAERGRRWLLPAMLVLSGGWAFAASSETPHYQSWLRWTALAAAVVVVAVLVSSRLRRLPALTGVAALAAVVALLAAPAVWAGSVVVQRPGAGGGASAAAGPPQQMMAGMKHEGNFAARIKGFMRGPDARLLSYLRTDRGRSRFAAAVNGSMGAAGYLAAGLPVLPMGGFTGAAPAPTVDGLAAMVRSGSVRYVVLGGERPDEGGAAKGRDAWVEGHCHRVALKTDGTGSASGAVGGAGRMSSDGTISGATMGTSSNSVTGTGAAAGTGRASGPSASDLYDCGR